MQPPADRTDRRFTCRQILVKDKNLESHGCRRVQTASQNQSRGGTETAQLPIFELVLKGISVIGSIVGTRKALQETLELAARGLVTCQYTTAKMEDINDIFAALRAGKIDGRVVLQID